jgi:MIP family channel proteins
MFNSKVFLAEFIGTFALVFIGAGAGVGNAGIVGVALAHGLTVAVFAYTFGHISGTHINPAVTFGLLLTNTIKLGQAVYYWIAQFAGAILASLLLQAIAQSLGGTIIGAATTGALTQSQPILAMVVEALLTFFLVNAVLHNAVAGRSGAFAGLVIGLTLVAAILVGGPLTGASLNPARTFGPAIFTEPGFLNVNTYVIYLFGPLIGSTLAVIAFNFFNGSDEVQEEVEPESEVTSVKAKKPSVRKVAKK